MSPWPLKKVGFKRGGASSGVPMKSSLGCVFNGQTNDFTRGGEQTIQPLGVWQANRPKKGGYVAISPNRGLLGFDLTTIGGSNRPPVRRARMLCPNFQIGCFKGGFSFRTLDSPKKPCFLVFLAKLLPGRSVKNNNENCMFSRILLIIYQILVHAPQAYMGRRCLLNDCQATCCVREVWELANGNTTRHSTHTTQINGSVSRVLLEA